ncbi:MAG TPA: metallopeptidase TldD-related protein [Thermoanaerobaculia bacterium]
MELPRPCGGAGVRARRGGWAVTRRDRRPPAAEAPPPEAARFDAPLADVLAGLARAGFAEAEVYAKRGRSRRVVHAPGTRAASFHEERGWAVRASTGRASLFAAGTGAPPPDGPWPEPDGRPLRLPDPDAAGRRAPWSEPSELEAPLVGEAEGDRLLAAIGEELARELPGARLVAATLEDGSSESRIASSRSVEARWRSRVALLHLEAVIVSRTGAGVDPAAGRPVDDPGSPDGDRLADGDEPKGGDDAGEQGPEAAPGSSRSGRQPGAVPRAERPPAPSIVTLDLAARSARGFSPGAVARRLADRLAVAAAGPPAGFAARDRGELVLAPPLAARLLAALTPYLVGPRAADRVAALRDRRGRIGSQALTVIDDGRLPGGLLEAPVDGEGLATRAVALVEEGAFRQPLLAWHEARGGDPRHGDPRPTGCSRRPSWRDLPRPGPTHLHLAPAPAVPAADLLADLARGYYLLDAAGPVALDLDAAAFTVPVAGYAIQSGRAVAPAGGLVLAGSVSALLRGIQAVARDLAFVPDDGLVGAPTVLVTGLELRPAGV